MVLLVNWMIPLLSKGLVAGTSMHQEQSDHPFVIPSYFGYGWRSEHSQLNIDILMSPSQSSHWAIVTSLQYGKNSYRIRYYKKENSVGKIPVTSHLLGTLHSPNLKYPEQSEWHFYEVESENTGNRDNRQDQPLVHTWIMILDLMEDCLYTLHIRMIVR